MSTFYKAVHPDGTDFHTGTVQWAPLDGTYPHHVQHPDSEKIKFNSGGTPNFSTCLSLSSEKTDCIGFEWPARLLTVEAPDAVHAGKNKYVCTTATVIEELPAHELFGPQGEHVIRLLAALEDMTHEQAKAVTRARKALNVLDVEYAWCTTCAIARQNSRAAAHAAALEAARTTAHAAALEAAHAAAPEAVYAPAQEAAWSAAGDAAAALVIRDRLPQERYDTATHPLRLAGFTVHPDDKEL